jgi:hypothetical protein
MTEELRHVEFKQVEYDSRADIATASCYVKSGDGSWRRMIQRGHLANGRFEPNEPPTFQDIP